MHRVAVFASGRGSNLESMFRAFEGDPEIEIALVISDRSDAPALDRARERGVPAEIVEPGDHQEILDLLQGRSIDWVVLAGYLRRVPAPVIDAFPGRILNIHPALLPRFGGKGMYGTRVHEAVLEAGVSESGVSVHIVDEEYDRGPVVAQRKVRVEPGDTPDTLAARVLEIEHALLPEVVRAACQGRVRVEGERGWIEEPPMTIRRAILSVWDKDELLALARRLDALGVELIASGGTARALEEGGLRVTTVEEVTGAAEFLDGRVKTLHPAIHGAILARRDRPSDMAGLAERGIEPIDLVVVNLYPFGDPECSTDLIDIGGVTLIRAAAKNWRHVAVASDPGDYADLVIGLEREGTVSGSLRHRLAGEAFRRTAWYDARIAEWLCEEPWPERWTVGARLESRLRYGENPHQEAALYADRAARSEDLVAAEVLQGKALSYNNYVDLEAARRVVRDLVALDSERAHCAIIKHTIPCGVASSGKVGGEGALEAYQRALAADPVSAFGGIVALTRLVERDLAARLSEHFLEAIYAPGFDSEAQEILARKKNLRLLSGPLPELDPFAFEVRRIGGGLLVQQPNIEWLPREGAGEGFAVPTAVPPTEDQWRDLLFAWTVCRSVASNAIVLARGLVTVGVGGGQTNRVGAVELAIKYARELGHDPAGVVLASDGFFPFADNVEKAVEAGIVAIIQPGGSRRDGEVVEAADRAGIAMVMTGLRQFRH